MLSPDPLAFAAGTLGPSSGILAQAKNCQATKSSDTWSNATQGDKCQKMQGIRPIDGELVRGLEFQRLCA